MKLINRRCPVCEDTKGDILYRCGFDSLIPFLMRGYGQQDYTPILGQEFALKQCGCGMIYQENVPDDELAVEIYNSWIDATKTGANHQRANLAHRLSLVREITAAINFLGGSPSDLRLFDFGMGWAEWCILAKGLGCDASGAELSKDRIRHAERHGIGVVDWNEIPGSEFDMINSEQVFEHVTEPQATLKHLKRGLKRGGIIRVSVPNGRKFVGLPRDIPWASLPQNGGPYNPVCPLEHVNTFTTASLVGMAERVGLRRVEIPISCWLRNFVKAETVAATLGFLLRLTAYARNRSTVLYFK